MNVTIDDKMFYDRVETLSEVYFRKGDDFRLS